MTKSLKCRSRTPGRSVCLMGILRTIFARIHTHRETGFKNREVALNLGIGGVRDVASAIISHEQT